MSKLSTLSSVKPKLVEAEEEVRAKAGDIVTLLCAFSGHPQPQVCSCTYPLFCPLHPSLSGDLVIKTCNLEWLHFVTVYEFQVGNIFLRLHP